MSLPVANFGFSRNSLEITFLNLSLNIDGSSTFAWDFGDGSNSTLKDPVKTYVISGFFNVSLTVTNGADINTISIAIGVGQTLSMLNVPLLSMCYYYLPSTLLSKTKEIVTLIQTYQLYLQPLVENPLVDTNDTHNELKWPALVNKLIAMMVSKEIILKEANSFLANMANEGGNSSSSVSNQTSQIRQIKSIETGPAKTEWYEASDTLTNSETLKNIGDAFYKATYPGGLVDKLQEAICGLSKRLNIYLPDCGKLNINPRGIQLGGTPDIGSDYNKPLSYLEIINIEQFLNW